MAVLEEDPNDGKWFHARDQVMGWRTRRREWLLDEDDVRNDTKPYAYEYTLAAESFATATTKDAPRPALERQRLVACTPASATAQTPRHA